MIDIETIREVVRRQLDIHEISELQDIVIIRSTTLTKIKKQLEEEHEINTKRDIYTQILLALYLELRLQGYRPVKIFRHNNSIAREIIFKKSTLCTTPIYCREEKMTILHAADLVFDFLEHCMRTKRPYLINVSKPELGYKFGILDILEWTQKKCGKQIQLSTILITKAVKTIAAALGFTVDKRELSGSLRVRYYLYPNTSTSTQTTKTA